MCQTIPNASATKVQSRAASRAVLPPVRLASFSSGSGGDLTSPSTFATSTNWVDQDASPRFTDVSCPSSSECFAVGPNTSQAGSAQSGSVIFETTDEGIFWQPAYFSPSGDNSTLYAISCPSTSDCTAVGISYGGVFAGAEIVSTTDGGALWTTTELTDTGGFRDVSCPTTSVCVAVGSAPEGGGALVAATTGGGSWSTWDNGSLVGSLWVTCTSASSCVVVSASTTSGIDDDADDADTLDVVTSSGGAWSSAPTLDSRDGVLVRNDLLRQRLVPVRHVLPVRLHRLRRRDRSLVLEHVGSELDSHLEQPADSSRGASDARVLALQPHVLGVGVLHGPRRGRYRVFRRQ